MSDYLDLLAHAAQLTVKSEYYEKAIHNNFCQISLKKAILYSKVNPVITEIKSASPSAGVIRTNVDPAMIAQSMEKGGAIALSVLTEPKQFKGSLEALSQARKTVNLPILMKDIILSPMQIFAASKLGANAILLIQAIFDRGYCEKNLSEMIIDAHGLGLEVLLETHTEEEFHSAVKTDADLIGINNRNLGTLKIDLNTTKEILKNNNSSGKVIVSESGIKNPEDLRFLRKCGAKAFLIGSSIMLTENIEKKVKEFVKA
ncbi:indole-3-glycerol-phosphate synthase [Candidatus Bathyarchaeota archaeon]|nr:MAG: indole-3-glycerol-phosphate synthase [Candidatus Bathyarchaeota archaeon]